VRPGFNHMTYLRALEWTASVIGSPSGMSQTVSHVSAFALVLWLTHDGALHLESMSSVVPRNKFRTARVMSSREP
jgi:hypothetical protein